MATKQRVYGLGQVTDAEAHRAAKQAERELALIQVASIRWHAQMKAKIDARRKELVSKMYDEYGVNFRNAESAMRVFNATCNAITSRPYFEIPSYTQDGLAEAAETYRKINSEESKREHRIKEWKNRFFVRKGYIPRFLLIKGGKEDPPDPLATVEA